MTLSKYHARFRDLTDQEIADRLDVKRQELAQIFEQTDFSPTKGAPAKIAVLGTADVRLVEGHKKIFSELLALPIELNTFDITIAHLAGSPNVVGHDVTRPLPGGPYDLCYGHVLLKFIETNKQLSVLQNSYNALKTGGIAIHVFDLDELEMPCDKLPDGLFTVPLERWKDELK